MIAAEFERLLQATMGLDAGTIGSPAVERAVQERQAACGLRDPLAYLELVRASEVELQNLIEAVVVPETWFFRDREAFAALARIVFESWLPHHPTGTLRLLSLPCSTGEEPYSMAMALLDAGLPAGRFRIDAIDISERALGLARRADYGRNSFRGRDLAFRDRYCSTSPRGWRLNDAVRSQVTFQQGNLFAPGFLPGAEIYDAIFCRNVLIYFDRTAQDEVVAVLRRLLTAEGALFVGPSETGLLLNHDFVSAKIPLAFAFRKVPAVPPQLAAALPEARRRSILVRPHVPSLPRVAAAPRPRAVPVPSVPAVTPAAGIEEAARLADQGRFAEAEAICQAHMRNHGATAEVLYLMGLLRDAAGRLDEAAQYYRKTLYLDRDHREALSHLALLLRKQGDLPGAQLLLARASRAERKGAG